MTNTSETLQQVQIPLCTPKNNMNKGFDSLFNYLCSLVSADKKEEFINEYSYKIKVLPFELEGQLSISGSWYSFVIDLMCNASHLREMKGYEFVSKQKLAKVCAIAFLGLLDMYEENNGRSRYYNQFFKFKDNLTSLFGNERTILICCKYGIPIDDIDIECISFTKNISNGEKMTIVHASATARLFYSAYMLTKIDHQI